MTAKDWGVVDAYLAERLIGADPHLDAALDANAAAGLPAIDVSPLQGKMLHLLARMMGARRILEIGTLGGYSTLWFARALPEDGTVVTLELEPHHAAVARANIARAGLSGRVDLRIGPALESLDRMIEQGAEPFDLVFIDADKPNNPSYLERAMKLVRPGSAIIGDNVVRSGDVADRAARDPSVDGVRRFIDMLAEDPRLDATAIQTVGSKGWDGFALALVISSDP